MKSLLLTVSCWCFLFLTSVCACMFIAAGKGATMTGYPLLAITNNEDDTPMWYTQVIQGEARGIGYETFAIS